MKNPLVSIIMPIYNASLYIHEAIESVLNQTYSNYEFIIIDDGSTDQSNKIIENYHDERIIHIRSNHDFIASLNLGLKKSSGKYIARMDGDDIMLPTRLEIQVNFMENNPEIAICGSAAEQFGDIIGKMPVEKDHNKLRALMLITNPMIHPSIIMKKSELGHHVYSKGYDYAEDYKLWTDLAVQGKRFANIPDVLLRYRTSPKQVSSIHKRTMYMSSLKVQTEYADNIMESILNKDNFYFDFFDQSINLCNNKRISVTSFLHIIYSTYCDYLKLKD